MLGAQDLGAGGEHGSVLGLGPGQITPLFLDPGQAVPGAQGVGVVGAQDLGAGAEYGPVLDLGPARSPRWSLSRARWWRSLRTPT